MYLIKYKLLIMLSYSHKARRVLFFRAYALSFPMADRSWIVCIDRGRSSEKSDLCCLTRFSVPLLPKPLIRQTIPGEPQSPGDEILGSPLD